MFVCLLAACCHGNDYNMANFNTNFQAPERDGENGQARNMLSAEHISLIIGKSTVEGEFRGGRLHQC